MRYTAICPSEIRFLSVLGLMLRIFAASSTRNRADGRALRRTPPGKAFVDSFLAPDSLVALRECPSSDFDLRPRLFVAESVRLRESAAVIEIPPSKCRRIVRTLKACCSSRRHTPGTLHLRLVCGGVSPASSDRLLSFTCLEAVPRFTRMSLLRGAVALTDQVLKSHPGGGVSSRNP